MANLIKTCEIKFDQSKLNEVNARSGDIVNVQIRRYRQWQLSQTSSVATSIIPYVALSLLWKIKYFIFRICSI